MIYVRLGIIAFLCVFWGNVLASGVDSKVFVERGDTMFVGGNWYIKNPDPAEKVSRAPLPFVPTDSNADSGIVWEEEVPVTYDASRYHPESEMRNNNIYTIWFGQLLGPLEIFSKASTDFGYTWSDSSVLSIVGTSSDDFGNVNGNDSLIFVVWCGGPDDGTYLRKAELSTGNWSEIITVAEYIEGGDPFTYRPDITNSQIELYATYEGCDHTGHNQRFKKSTDYGDTWFNERVVGGLACGKGAEIAYGDGVIHVVRGSCGFTDVRYDRSTDLGETWSDDSFISDIDEHYSQWPSVAADPYGNVYATWFDYKDSPHGYTGYLFFRRSTDHGETWEDIQYLSTEPTATWSDIHADSNGVYAVWTEGNPFGNVETYFRMSPDFGINWSPEIALNDISTSSSEPEINGHDGYLSVVWRTVKSGYYFAVSHKLGGRYLPGDADGSRIIEISDVVYLISYIFSGGTPPVLYESGDADCNEIVEISDAVYLVNYIFNSGPAPCEE